MPRKAKREGFVMISVVAKRYNIHPQTLRMYEREGLLQPARTGGNTRLYGPEELRRLEMILRLTRDLGVNLSGVEVILGLCRKLQDEASINTDRMLDLIRGQVIDRRIQIDRSTALVRVEARHLQRFSTTPGADDDEESR